MKNFLAPIAALLLGGALCAASAGSAAADNDFAPQMRAELANTLSRWIEDPVIVAAVKAQNAKTAGYDQAKIDALDAAWSHEVGKEDTPTISPVLDNAASRFLRDKVAASDGRIIEVFVMDAKGLNVAAAAPTSDYWQGDEAKFQNSFGKGKDGVDIGDVEFDESSQTYLAQISSTITDPESGTPIGAITIGLNTEALQ
ncbi:hypothetical protein [Acidimangrovimonas sediminis]|uniref:hypothetical protein n=1 Tax=Acidimangrovimonas sediminis TaxID=2056283 RepID=UPI001E304A0E|nr:hypothetical protein [Acidimangrovimonas sediminis]